MLHTIRVPWIFAADCNCTPTQLKDTGWLQLVGGVIVAPKLAACNARTIDFFVVSKDLAAAVAGIVVIDDAVCNPHSPVRLYIRADTRMMTVRSLKAVDTLGGGGQQPIGRQKDWRWPNRGTPVCSEECL